jgi:hypothetical protein
VDSDTRGDGPGETIASLVLGDGPGETIASLVLGDGPGETIASLVLGDGPGETIASLVLGFKSIVLLGLSSWLIPGKLPVEYKIASVSMINEKNVVTISDLSSIPNLYILRF